jgi:transposase-like protein
MLPVPSALGLAPRLQVQLGHGEVEEAVLEMYLQGVSTRKVAAITEGLSRVRIGKDAVSRVAQRLEEELSAWRGRPLELAYPYLYLDAAYFKVNWGGRVVDLALLVGSCQDVCVSVCVRGAYRS